MRVIHLSKIKDALLKNRIGDYVAVTHHEEDKVAILKRPDAEQTGYISPRTLWNGI